MSARFVFRAYSVYLAVTVGESAAGVVSMYVLTRHLTPRDYGVILLIANGAALINMLFGYSLAQALPTLFANAPTPERRRDVARTIVASITVVSLPLHAAIALLSRPISMLLLKTPEFAGPIAFGALASFWMSTALCLANVVRLLERHMTYMWVQLPAIALQLGLLIPLLIFGGLGLNAPYLAMAAAGLYATIFYLIAVRPWLSGNFERAVVGQAAGIAASMLPWQLATLLTTNCAGFFLARSGHLEEAGLFAIAASTATVLVGLSNSFASVWTPFVLNRHAATDLAITQVRIFSLYSGGLLIAACGLSLFARELFALVAGPAFQAGFHLVPPLALAFSIFCFANSFAQGLQAKQRMVHYAWIGTLTSVVFLAVALLLVGRWGATGIIASMNAGFLTMLVSLQLVSSRLMPVAYPWARHSLMWLVAAGIVWVTYPSGLSWAALSIKVAAMLGIAGLIFGFGALRVSDLRAATTIFIPLRRA